MRILSVFSNVLLLNGCYKNESCVTDSLNPQLNALKYKLQLALHMLEKKSYDFNQEITILTPLDNSTFNPNSRKTAEFFQEYLSALSVKSEIIPLPKVALEKRLTSGNYDGYLTGLTGRKLNSSGPISRMLRFNLFKQNIFDLILDPLTGINFHNVQKVEAL